MRKSYIRFRKLGLYTPPTFRRLLTGYLWQEVSCRICKISSDLIVRPFDLINRINLFNFGFTVRIINVNENIMIHGLVKNNGKSDIAYVTVQFFIGPPEKSSNPYITNIPNLIGTAVINLILSGESLDIKYPAKKSNVENKDVYIVIDPQNLIEESDKLNNVAFKNFPSIANQPPVANAGGPYLGTEGQSIVFNASASYDPGTGDAIASYEWDFNNDGVIDATGIEATWTWNDDYTGQVSLTVTDSNGESSTNTTTVTVLNSPPIVNSNDLTAQWGDTVTLYGSFTDPGDDSWTAEIDWGDGSPAEAGTISNKNVTATHVYSTPGEYVATLTVQDDDGGSGSKDINVTVTARATKLEYIGDLTAQYSDSVTLRAQLNDSVNNSPISGRSINFTLGAQIATATTGTDGIASTTLKLNQPAGSYNVLAEFAGDNYYGQDSDTKPFSIIREDVNVAYTGDTIVPKSASSISLRATLNENDTDYGDLTKVKVNFTIYKSSDLSYSNPVATVPSVASISVTSSGAGVGTAQATINNLPVDDYMVIARIVPNDYYGTVKSSPTPLIVYEPTGQFTTGGGWINDPTGSHGSFGFTVRYNKKDKVQGNSVYVYRQNGFDYIVKSNAWIGLAIKDNTSSFQGKAALQIYDPTTGLLQPESSGNFQFTVEAVDNEASGSPDTYKITVLDKDGLVYHSATGELQGGNIVIHEK